MEIAKDESIVEISRPLINIPGPDSSVNYGDSWNRHSFIAVPECCVVTMTPEEFNDSTPLNFPNRVRPDNSTVGSSFTRRMRSLVNELQNERINQVSRTRPRTIFRVPRNIRSCNQEAYDPLVVPIGTYYPRRDDLEGTFKAIESYKSTCLRRLLLRHRSRRSATKLLDRCVLAVHALGADIRSCYADPFFEDLEDFDLAGIMLLDGCFILHLLLKQHLRAHEKKLQELRNNKPQDDDDDDDDDDDEAEDGEMLLEIGEEKQMEGPLMGKLWLGHLVLYDLLKLENQIPFFVLTTLFNLLKAPGDEDINLVELAFQLFRDIHPSKSQNTGTPVLPSADEVLHLLHLFHYTLVVPSEQHHQQLDISQAVEAPEWVPTATELHQAGVKFVMKKNASSFLDISFSRRNGIMEIPKLCLYDYTDTLFRNLIAFEQSYPGTRTYITIYASFMDCIIDTPNDVRLLHLEGILSNRLSTDEAAAGLFNKLTYQIHYASDRNYLHQLFVDVNEYHESRWNRWRAGLVRDYFSNPWAIISLIAAVVLLLLTIEQSFFTAYSYFNPPS